MRTQQQFETRDVFQRATKGAKLLILICALSGILLAMGFGPGVSLASSSLSEAAALPDSSEISATTPYLFKDLRTGTEGSSPGQFTLANNLLFFSARDDDGDWVLWQSDGSQLGTIPIGDSYYSHLEDPDIMTEYDGSLFLGANTAYSSWFKIYKTDGTLAGTEMVSDLLGLYPVGMSFIGGHIVFDGTLYFFMSYFDFRLWKTDGTSASMVKDIPFGSDPAPDAEHLIIFGDEFYFHINKALWKSDGTAEGTVLVKNFATDYIQDMVLFDGRLFISANGGEPEGWELWVSDGTPEGTTLFKDIYPGSTGSNPSNLRIMGSTLYFNADDGMHGRELWKTDGTPEETEIVKDIITGTWGSNPGFLGILDSNIYFRIWNEDNSHDLWKSDGTEGGTLSVKDFPEGEVWPFGYFTLDESLYFVGDLPDTGNELWSTDGTESGTGIVADINPGSGNSNPGWTIEYDHRWFFEADDGVHGDELWAMALSGEDHFIYLPAVLTPPE